VSLEWPTILTSLHGRIDELAERTNVLSARADRLEVQPGAKLEERIAALASTVAGHGERLKVREAQQQRAADRLRDPALDAVLACRNEQVHRMEAEIAELQDLLQASEEGDGSTTRLEAQPAGDEALKAARKAGFMDAVREAMGLLNGAWPRDYPPPSREVLASNIRAMAASVGETLQ
jgi:hypothetical protein